MNRLEILKARTLSKYVQLEVSREDPLLFLFLIKYEGNEVRITLNNKGWLCDAGETSENYERRCYLAKKKGKERPIRWNHAMNINKECEHILACKIYLRKNNLDRVDVTNSMEASEISDIYPQREQND
jgi:hypothetical protein